MTRVFVFLLTMCMVCVFAEGENLLHTKKAQDEIIQVQSLLGREHKIHDYHVAMRRVGENHPDIVRYIVANGQKVLGKWIFAYKLPRSIVLNSVFAQNKENGVFVTYRDYLASPESHIGFFVLDDAQFKAMTLHAYQQLARDFILNVDGVPYHRDSLIREIESESDLGNRLLRIEKDFLTAVRNDFWEFEVEEHTDSNGNFTSDIPSFDAKSSVLSSVQLSWRGLHESFVNAQFVVNGKEIFNGEALNYESYSVGFNVSAKNNRCQVTATGGPADSVVKVTLADCG